MTSPVAGCGIRSIRSNGRQCGVHATEHSGALMMCAHLSIVNSVGIFVGEESDRILSQDQATLQRLVSGTDCDHLVKHVFASAAMALTEHPRIFE